MGQNLYEQGRADKKPPQKCHHITDLGRKLLDNHSGPIDNNLLSEFEGFEDWRGARSTETDAKTMEGALSVPSATTPTEQLDLSFTQIRNALADTLLERLRNETPAFFEQAVIDLLIAMGYGGGRSERGRAIGRSNDGGLDGVVHEDALGLDAVYVQAKRYAEGSGIGRPDIQQFVGSLTGEGASKGVFFTTSHFSSQARDYAARITQRVELIDGQRLARLMIDHKVGVRVERTFVVPEIDENFFTLD